MQLIEPPDDWHGSIFLLEVEYLGSSQSPLCSQFWEHSSTYQIRGFQASGSEPYGAGFPQLFYHFIQ
jgi:hypothetical protein